MNSTASASHYFSADLTTDGTSTCRVLVFDTRDKDKGVWVVF